MSDLGFILTVLGTVFVMVGGGVWATIRGRFLRSLDAEERHRRTTRISRLLIANGALIVLLLLSTGIVTGDYRWALWWSLVVALTGEAALTIQVAVGTQNQNTDSDSESGSRSQRN